MLCRLLGDTHPQLPYPAVNSVNYSTDLTGTMWRNSGRTVTMGSQLLLFIFEPAPQEEIHVWYCPEDNGQRNLLPLFC